MAGRGEFGDCLRSIALGTQPKPLAMTRQGLLSGERGYPHSCIDGLASL